MVTDPLAAARAALARGDATGARSVLEAFCAEQPGSAEAWFLLGAARHRCGLREAALEAFSHAAERAPGVPAIANARAVLLVELDRPEAAREVLEQALHGVDVPDLQVLLNLGIALERSGDRQLAESRYREAITAARRNGHPVLMPALLNLGALLLREGRAPEALPLNRELVQRAPALADAHFNLAENCLAIGATEEALSAADAALGIDAGHVFARIDRAFALALLDRLPEAQQELSRAKADDPARFASYRNAYDPDGSGVFEGLDARLLFIQWHYQKLIECDWSRYEHFVERCRTLIESHQGWPTPLGHTAVPYRMLALPLPANLHVQLARHVGDALRESVEQEGIAPYAPPVGSARTRALLRIGYLSPDFRRHPTAHLTRDLYGAHDRSQVEVIGYSLHDGPDDALTLAVEAGCDAFHRVAGDSTRDLVERIRADDLDVLVDLAGHTAHARPAVFAARAAPVQVTWLGMPWTTGIANMDYAFVDRGSVPVEAEHCWSEKLVFLPGSCYVASPAIIGPVPTRAACGLPEEGTVFCCLSNTWKIEPRIFACWMRILAAVPRSVLWLVGTSAGQTANLRSEVARSGIDPARLVFTTVVDHPTHLARYLVADLFLDTPIYNGHTTALDALQAGLPILTCPGEIMPSRVAATFLEVLGVADSLVVPNMEAYVQRAQALAGDPRRLADLRHRIDTARAAAPMFQPQRFAQTLERAFVAMVERQRRGLPPASFDV